ncbi:hypothetical protein ACJJTC_008776 [Scirpophaga incertulas]
MEIVRRQRQLQDQENIFTAKGKSTATLPAKKQGLSIRGALGELNSNVQAQREINIGKVAVATAEFEKKAINSRGLSKSNYSHVQSKVDTGLASKSQGQPTARPPLKREESTASLAARAVARIKASNKEIKTIEIKETINIQTQNKRSFQDVKRSKLPTVREHKDNKALKPILKESTESLGKLKLTELIPDVPQQITGIIDQNKVEKRTTSLDIPALPDDIEDIDAADKNNPLLMSTYIKDIYHYLTELELKYPIEPDHLKNQSEITGKMRATLIDWLVEVQRQFSLVLETFHLTVGIIDRYLQIVPNVKRNQLQLVGVTAMLIASKYEEIYSPDPCDFVYVTDHAYSKSDVFRCEIEILSKLGYCLARPIPLSFLRRFVKVAYGTSKNHHLAKYFVDLCLIEYSMAQYRPSELAAAAICLSLHLLSGKKLEQVWTPTLSYYSDYSLDHIDPIIKKMAKVVINVEKSKYKAVYNKYLDPTLAKVASLPELKGVAINELANLSSS